ncbi:TetR/AcrR family transcriptional regulator [Nocardia sp. BMG111209]|uniref:TetR/AcrR family transcriptional regulator n=1 Tax=Nocardia sp. BMG111209 TaxID=1160137 RepID=UPI000366274D|nr:TetR/AcrR family transcriptional regulator [Nocardia sp. BMG111209]
MPQKAQVAGAVKRQRRATFQRSGSQQTKAALAQSATALWRTNGYAATTVADICKAAGVSRALFYFYFPSKEDLLFEVGIQSTRAAQDLAAKLSNGDHPLETIIHRVLDSLGRSMARNPADLVVETVLEGYRRQHRPAADPRTEPASRLFTDVFVRARADGRLAAEVDADHLSHLAQILVNEGARHWASGAYGEKSYADAVSADILALVAGFEAAAAKRD